MSSHAHKLDHLVFTAMRLARIQICKGKIEESMETLHRVRPYVVIRKGNSDKWFAGAINRFQENLDGT
jgi:hypothetical protein